MELANPKETDMTVYPKYEVSKVINPMEWFQFVTGKPETAWLERRAGGIEDGDPLSQEIDFGPHLVLCRPGKDSKWDAGAFRTWSLNELEAIVSSRSSVPMETNSQDEHDCIFEIHIRCTGDIVPVEVSCLQASADREKKSMFQVASNFNCCENGSHHSKLDSGHFVTDLMIDSTQGPAAAAGAGVSAITRTHAAFYNRSVAPEQWGQTSERQIELLGDPAIAPHFPVTNGKLYVNPSAASPEPWTYNPDSSSIDHQAGGDSTADASAEGRWGLMGHVRAGLHCDVYGNFARPDGRGAGLVVNPPKIDQVFVAAMNMYAPGAKALPPAERRSKGLFLLRAAYHCTYAAAAVRGTEVLVLTCVGGGVFSNDLADIADAAAAAHAACAPRARRLRRVVLPLFPRGADPAVFVEALARRGVRAVVKHWK